MIVSCAPEGYAGCCAAVRDMKLTAELNRINKSTLIIAGELDPATPVSHSELINRHIEGSELSVIGVLSVILKIGEFVGLKFTSSCHRFKQSSKFI